MTAPTQDTVKSYYDDRVDGKLRDFTDFNPRIEAAVRTLADWAPQRPKRVLEIGCGIGATSWRMARAWPEADVIGADVSPRSIEVARTCFKLPNLTYFEGFIEPGVIAGKFDLIVLMDVYEHIAVQDRPVLHRTIRELLSDDARVFVSVPTPAHLEFLRKHHPQEIQPVDEDVGPLEAHAIAQDSQSELLNYRQVGIWSYGDYAHFVFGRFNRMSALDSRLLAGSKTLKQKLKSIVKNDESDLPRNYLGPDVRGDTHPGQGSKFLVPSDERKVIASLWLSQQSK
jgi:SAM-dependent methyltransferase